MRAPTSLLCAGLVLVLGACGAHEESQESPGQVVGKVVRAGSLGPVSARVRLTPENPRFGERMKLTLDVTWDEGTQVEDCDLGPRFGHLRVRSRKGPLPVGARHQRYQIEAEAERTGTNIIRFPDVVFHVLKGEGQGQTRSLHLAPLEIQVAGLAAEEEPDLANLSAALAGVRLPAGDRGDLPWWLVAVGLAALILGGGWFLKHRRRTLVAEPQPLDPTLEAQAALEALLARGLVQAGRLGEFYLQLTAIVRRYVERTSGIRAPEQTTEEFLRAMEASADFSPQRRLELSDFLEAADLVKFAAQVPQARDITQAVARARTFCGVPQPEGVLP